MRLRIRKYLDESEDESDPLFSLLSSAIEALTSTGEKYAGTLVRSGAILHPGVLADASAQPASDLADLWRTAFREMWAAMAGDDIGRRTALAVVHGLVERAGITAIAQHQAWLSDVYIALSRNTITALELEISARVSAQGLPLFDPERSPTTVTGSFAVVSSVSDGYADLSFLNSNARSDPKASLWEGIEVPTCDFPSAYCVPGVWVCWVERGYASGSTIHKKGRFEPAGPLLPQRRQMLPSMFAFANH